MAGIHKLSTQSLLITMYYGDTSLATGTGFIANSGTGRPYLVTNRHNFTLRRQDNGQPMFDHGGVPDRVRVWHHLNTLGSWNEIGYQLYKDDAPRWLEHPSLNSACDVVALEMTPMSGVAFYPFDLKSEGKLMIQPSEPANIIGFPFGQSAGGLFPIWVTGFIASEMEIDYGDMPRFLIDSRTRPGQSGSPVVAVRNGSASMAAGGLAIGGSWAEFIGIYAGRIHPDSDIGIVWKKKAIVELLDSVP